MALVAPTTMQTIAIGLAAIQMSSGVGNERRTCGWAQYEEIDSVEAQANAATPPGTRPRFGHGCPPVPGHPFPKCRLPITRNAARAKKRNDGPTSRDRPLTTPLRTHQTIGTAAIKARMQKRN